MSIRTEIRGAAYWITFDHAKRSNAILFDVGAFSLQRSSNEEFVRLTCTINYEFFILTNCPIDDSIGKSNHQSIISLQMYNELCRAMDDANENEETMITVFTGKDSTHSILKWICLRISLSQALIPSN